MNFTVGTLDERFDFRAVASLIQVMVALAAAAAGDDRARSCSPTISLR